MSTSTQTFAAPRSIRLIAQITELIREQIMANVADVIDETGLCERSARSYLNHMTVAGLIHCSYRASRRTQHNKQSEWMLGGETVIAPDDVSDNDDFPRRIVIRTQWRPHHARMPMECLLFGVPSAMRAAS